MKLRKKEKDKKQPMNPMGIPRQFIMDLQQHYESVPKAFGSSDFNFKTFDPDSGSTTGRE